MRAVRGVAVSAEPLSRRTCIRSTRDRCRAGANENRSAGGDSQERGEPEHVRIDRHFGRARQREARHAAQQPDAPRGEEQSGDADR
jgi:hypothetical protein